MTKTAKGTPPRIAVVTNCTATGTMLPSPGLEGKDLEVGSSLDQVLEVWKTSIDQALLSDEFRTTPLELYRGISFHKIISTMDALKGLHCKPDLFVVSEGFGLIKSDKVIASYDIHIGSGDDPSSLANIITGEPFKPHRWWEGLNFILNGTTKPLKAMIASNEYALIILALTGRFIDLVSTDLNDLNLHEMRKVRMVGPSTRSALGGAVGRIVRRGNTLPYDRRLKQIYVGNRNDFPQRCALHFVKEILPLVGLDASIEQHVESVQQAMNAIGTLDRIGSIGEEISAKKLREVLLPLKDSNPTLSVEEALEKLRAQGIVVSEVRLGILWSNDVADSEEALKAFNDVTELHRVGSTGTLNPDVVQALKVLIKTLRAHNPQVTLTAKSISVWALQYYKLMGTTCPSELSSAKKVSGVLRRVGDVLGFLPIEKTNQFSTTNYRIALED